MVLGKRKEREENELDPLPSHGSTLFVSNLPFTATSVDLQTLFSDIAPVRSAFVVTEHGTGVSKGVGYVSFAMKEDAESVYGKLSQEGITLAGRKLRVDWADPKSKYKSKDSPVKKEPKKLAPRPSVLNIPGDPNAIRTIVISGLPPSIDAKQLWKKIRKYKGAEKVEWPHKAEDGSEDRGIAHILFSTPATANEAVSKLHAHVFKGSLLSVTLKKRLENLAKLVVKQTKNNEETANKTPAMLVPSHASRLIVRNLPFNITEQDLRAIFLPYGPIYSINIPTVDPPTITEDKPEGESSTVKPKPRIKGFAFVWMLSKKDAEKAIEGCNGQLVRAGAAESLISDKQKKKKQKRLEKKLKASEKGKEPEREAEANSDMEQDEDEKMSERVIAVDWALSKNKWEEEKAKIAQQLEQENEPEGADVEEDVSEGSGSGDDSSVNEENENLGVHPGEDENNEEDGLSGEESEDQEEPVKPQLPPPDVGTTVFVRNVPFTATEDELRVLFRTFGPLRYARITMDPELGRSRGTGFVCFWNKEDADKVIEQSDLLRAETTGTAAPPMKKNPFVLPSILTPDPSSSLAQSLVLHGRTLDVVRAVTRDEAGKLKEAGEKARQKADKRNMYLLKEGVILPNSPLAQNLPPADLERRTNSYNARRALLKSNPSLYISRTRLSIRQIPLFVTERALKRLALHSLKAFESEVQAGDRNPLTAEELIDLVPPYQEIGNDQEGRPGKKRKRLVTKVKQTKIIRQQDRVDPITGKGRSKGYGFIEMHKHSDALRVLRWANCNPGVELLFEKWYKEELGDFLKMEKGKEVKQKDEAKIKEMKDEIQNGPSKKGKASLIVEFSIENIQVVQRRNAKQTLIRSPQGDGDGASKKRKPARKESPAPARADDPSPQKKRRISAGEAEETELKMGRSVGEIIGRKRKERRKRGAKG